MIIGVVMGEICGRGRPGLVGMPFSR